MASWTTSTASLSKNDEKGASLKRNMIIFLVISLLMVLRLTKQMSMLPGYEDKERSAAENETNAMMQRASSNLPGYEDKERSAAENETNAMMQRASSNRRSKKVHYQMGIDYHMKKQNGKNHTDSIRGEDVRDVVIPIPRNLRIAFLGDSLSRYMYLSLVHFLKFGRWVDPDARPNLVMEKTHDGWISYYHYTNDLLQPYEVCDCFRPDNIGRARMVIDCRENRFYWDPVRNNSISFLQKWGEFPIRLSWPASTLHTAKHSVPNRKIPAMVEYNESQMIRNYLLQMDPPPNVLIFNAGLWDGHGYERAGYRRDILDALKDMNVLGIYKTTTKRRDEILVESQDYEHQLCAKTSYCLNLTWTAFVPKDLYWDHLHFVEPIYKRMNFQLLELLSHIDQQLNHSLFLDVEEPSTTTTTTTSSAMTDLETKNDNL